MKLLLWIGTNGWIGAVLCFGVYLYDPLMTGLRGFYEWNFGPKGYVISAVGMLWLVIAWAVERMTAPKKMGEW